MGLITLFLLAIGLCFDTFAVSVSSGLIRKEIVFWQAARIAFFLATFQAVMPVLGWLGGITIRNWIEPFDHWVALGILTILGVKMLLESQKSSDDKNIDPLDIKVIISMALATSIDAFAVGISFAIIEVNMLLAVIIIGLVTFIASMLGILFGKKTGSRFGQKMEIIGGIILIAIGIKIVIEHYNS
ncbi:MAG: manganese efflux pump [Bacteroidales bacterium]|nr:manganese efflux pump [Bacteroidales bacterium]